MTGPLTSAAHRDKVEAYVAAGLAEGAVLRCGGRRPDDPPQAPGRRERAGRPAILRRGLGSKLQKMVFADAASAGRSTIAPTCSASVRC